MNFFFFNPFITHLVFQHKLHKFLGSV